MLVCFFIIFNGYLRNCCLESRYSFFLLLLILSVNLLFLVISNMVLFRLISGNFFIDVGNNK